MPHVQAPTPIYVMLATAVASMTVSALLLVDMVGLIQEALPFKAGFWHVVRDWPYLLAHGQQAREYATPLLSTGALLVWLAMPLVFARSWASALAVLVLVAH